MPRGLRKKTKQYVLDRFEEENPAEYFKYKTKSAYGLTLDQMEFLKAVEFQSIQKVRSMLNRGVDPNFMVSRTQQTPLHLAVESKKGSEATCEKILGVLLFFGANPNAQDRDGRSPLHLACLCGNTAAAELLLQAGADVNIMDCIQETPLLSACRQFCAQSSQICDLLVAKGSDVSHINDRKQSALHLLSSCYGNQSDPVWNIKDRHCLVKTLLTNGLCVNTVDEKGLSPLCYELILLVKSYGTAPCMLNTVKVLISGGAELVVPQDFDEIKSVIGSVGRTSVTAAHLFAKLVADVYQVMACTQSKLLLRIAHRVHFYEGISLDGPIRKDIESMRDTVPSLAQLCRINVKQSLGGYVFSNVKFLPLPDKMKDYICSCD